MAIITASIPTGKPILYFIPNITFDDTIGGQICTYVKDEQYTLRENNDELAEKLNLWRSSNLVKMIEIKEI